MGLFLVPVFGLATAAVAFGERVSLVEGLSDTVTRAARTERMTTRSYPGLHESKCSDNGAAGTACQC
jgi:hypothetical protein